MEDPAAGSDHVDMIARRLRPLLERRPEIRFAFLHGSVLGRTDPPDVDVAVWLDAPAPDPFDAATTLSIALTRESGLSVDVQIVNGAPVGVLHQVFRGRLILARDEAEATDLIERVAEEALAFSHHILEYLEAVTT